jgi:hypothetical protein
VPANGFFEWQKLSDTRAADMPLSPDAYTQPRFRYALLDRLHRDQGADGGAFPSSGNAGLRGLALAAAEQGRAQQTGPDEKDAARLRHRGLSRAYRE